MSGSCRVLRGSDTRKVVQIAPVIIACAPKSLPLVLSLVDSEATEIMHRHCAVDLSVSRTSRVGIFNTNHCCKPQR